MNMNRRHFLAMAAAVAALPLVATAVPGRQASRIVRARDVVKSPGGLAAYYLHPDGGWHQVGGLLELDLDTLRGIQRSHTRPRASDWMPGGEWTDNLDGTHSREIKVDKVCLSPSSPAWIRAKYPDLPIRQVRYDEAGRRTIYFALA